MRWPSFICFSNLNILEEGLFAEFNVGTLFHRGSPTTGMIHIKYNVKILKFARYKYMELPFLKSKFG